MPLMAQQLWSTPVDQLGFTARLLRRPRQSVSQRESLEIVSVPIGLRR
jgi:hypothetical protein